MGVTAGRGHAVGRQPNQRVQLTDYADFAKGTTGIRALQSIDIAVRFLDWDWVFSAEGGRRVAFLLPCPGTLARLVKAAVCIANAKNIRTRTRKHLIAS